MAGICPTPRYCEEDLMIATMPIILISHNILVSLRQCVHDNACVCFHLYALSVDTYK